MAITTIQVTGKVVLPSGDGMPGGKIEVSLDEEGTVSDGAVEQQIGGKFTVAVGSDGSVDFNIIPKAEYNSGAGTYTARFILPDGTEFKKKWDNVPGTNADIGDL
jgi:hypothetical protein